MRSNLSISRMAYRSLFHALELFKYDLDNFTKETGFSHDFTANVDEKVHQADTTVLSSLINTISKAVGQKPGHSSNDADTDQSLVDQVKKYVIKHMSSSLPSADIVADALNISVSTLKRRLKLEGQNYRDLTQDLRTQIAKELLAANILSIYEISFMLGFSTSTSFSRAFKLWTGEAPTKYR